MDILRTNLDKMGSPSCYNPDCSPLRYMVHQLGSRYRRVAATHCHLDEALMTLKEMREIISTLSALGITSGRTNFLLCRSLDYWENKKITTHWRVKELLREKT